MRSLPDRSDRLFDPSHDTRSLADFHDATPKLLAEIQSSGRAMVLTVDGEPEFAVMSMATLQRAQEAVDLLDSIRCIREGLDQARRGEGMQSDEFFAAFRKKRGLVKPDA